MKKKKKNARTHAHEAIESKVQSMIRASKFDSRMAMLYVTYVTQMRSKCRNGTIRQTKTILQYSSNTTLKTRNI